MEESSSEDMIRSEVTVPQSEDDYASIMEDMPHGIETDLEDLGDTAVRSWDQIDVRVTSQCPECGATNDLDTVFCDGCGVRFMKAIPTSTLISPPPRLQDMRGQIQGMIPRYLTNRMLEDSKDIQEKYRLATAMFVNLSGAREIARSMSLDQYADTMNECFRVIVPAIYIKHEGCISRITGDNALALFGAPIIHENDTERAICAALDIRSDMEKLNLDVSIVINTGVIYMGEMDGDLFMECSSWNSDIDLANMIQNTVGSGEILVGTPAYRLTDRAFNFGEAVSFEFSGVGERQIAYPVLGIRDRPGMLGEIDELGIIPSH